MADRPGARAVMDDEPDILSFSHIVLKRLGYEAELARDAPRPSALSRSRRRGQARQPLGHHGPDRFPEGHGRQGSGQAIAEFDPQARAIVSSGYSIDPVMAEFQKHRLSRQWSQALQIHELQGAARIPAGDERQTARLTA